MVCYLLLLFGVLGGAVHHAGCSSCPGPAFTLKQLASIFKPRGLISVLNSLRVALRGVIYLQANEKNKKGLGGENAGIKLLEPRWGGDVQQWYQVGSATLPLLTPAAAMCTPVISPMIPPFPRARL